jgi:uncharacterized repeat protein (TIGR01451 family)
MQLDLRLACRAALAACLGVFALAPSLSLAQGQALPKEPTGPWVYYQMPSWHVTLGQLIEWEVRVSNTLSDDPIAADFWDTPQSRECEPDGLSRDWNIPSDPVAGNGVENAPQSALRFLDTDGDGNCRETVIDAAGGEVVCDAGTQTLRIKNAYVPGRPGSSTIRFLTYVDETVASPGMFVCNWAFVYDDMENDDPSDDRLIQPSGDPQKRITGCTCLVADPPSGYDFEADKTATPENVPLIPGDPSSTIVYRITGRNTGDTDISGASLTDTLPGSLAWVDAVTCPPPLTCTFRGQELTVSGWNIPSTDPDSEQFVEVRARVTCDAATDDDTGVVCNQGEFSFMGTTFPTDDPGQPGVSDETCLPVAFSNLTESTKTWTHDDTNGNGQLDAGERVHFTIHAINTGSLTARNVLVVDDIVDSPCFDPATLEALDGGSISGTYVRWPIGDLPNAMTAPIDVRFSVVLAADEPCCNQATLQSDERIDCAMDPIPTDDPTTPLTPQDPTCVAPGPQPNLVVTKEWGLEDDRDASGDATGGDVVSFTVRITNTGAGTATDATFTDEMIQCLVRLLNPLPDNLPPSVVRPNEISTTDGLDWGTDASVPFGGIFNPGQVIVTSLGGANGIVPGETITIKFYVRLERPDLCCNQGEVSYAERGEPKLTDDAQTPGLVDDPTCFTEPVATPDFAFDKSVDVFDVNGNGFVDVGDRAVWALTLTSTGASDLTNVSITDPTTDCYRVIDGSAVVDPAPRVTDTSVSGTNEISATVSGPMAPADVVSVTFATDLNAIGECCNQATFTSTELGTQLSNDPRDFIVQNPTCVTVVEVPTPDLNLTLTKGASVAGCVDPGTPVTFTLSVENTGMDPVRTWEIADPVPAGFTSVVPDPPLTYFAGVIRLDGTALGELMPGDTQRFTYSAVAPCTASGTLTNTATLTYEMTRTSESSASVTWGLPDIAASSKDLVSFDANGNGFNEVGETVTYRVAVRNTGSCAARDVLVRDVLDARFDAASVTYDPGDAGTVAGSTITWTSATVPELAQVDAGATVELVFHLSVLAATPPPQRIPNTVTVEARGHDLAACGLPAITDSAPANEDVPWGDQVVVLRRLDLLRNAAYPAESPASIFSAAAPNDDACGTTSLDEAGDIHQVDVEATLPGGLTVAGDAVFGIGRLIFYEVAEHCLVSEGGADDRICVKKSGSDVIVRSTPTPGRCP